MSLSTALSIAQSALRTTSSQTSIVSRNVTDANNADYTRRYAAVTSTAPGARAVSVQRAASELLFKTNLAENTVNAARDVVRSLNDGTAAIQSFRSDTDGEIDSAVKDLNELLI